MSKSGSERLSSTSLPMVDLIKLIKHSFCEREFNEIQDVLIDREKSMKIEMENLVRDRDLIKEEVVLLERRQNLTEIEKLNLEEKLQMSQNECEELNEKITRLIEEQRVSNDRAKRAEERYEKVSEENFKIAKEKNKVIFELNDKINELKNKNLESERLVGEYEEKFKSLDARVVIMSRQIQNLTNKKLAADQMVEELRQKESEADRVVNELTQKNLEATRAVEELRLKRLESDKEAELYKGRLKSLVPKITVVEVELANILKVKPEDLLSIVNEMDKRIAAEGGNVRFRDFKGDKDNLGNGRTQDRGNDDAEIVAMSPELRSACNSTRSASIGLSKKGGGILDQSSRTKTDVAKTVKINPGSQTGYNPPQTESKDDNLDNGRKWLQSSGVESKGLQDSGRHASGACSDDRVPVRGQCSVKSAPSSFTAGDIIEIYDSDDESNAVGAAYASDRGANVGKNETISEEFTLSRLSSQTIKRNSRDDPDINLTTKRKRSIYRSNGDNSPIDDKDIQVLESTHDRVGTLNTRLPQEKAGPTCGSQTPMQKFNALNDDDSSDLDDELCTDEDMEKLIASFRSRKLKTKWMYGADML